MQLLCRRFVKELCLADRYAWTQFAAHAVLFMADYKNAGCHNVTCKSMGSACNQHATVGSLLTTTHTPPYSIRCLLHPGFVFGYSSSEDEDKSGNNRPIDPIAYERSLRQSGKGQNNRAIFSLLQRECIESRLYCIIIIWPQITLSM